MSRSGHHQGSGRWMMCVAGWVNLQGGIMRNTVIAEYVMLRQQNGTAVRTALSWKAWWTVPSGTENTSGTLVRQGKKLATERPGNAESRTRKTGCL